MFNNDFLNKARKIAAVVVTVVMVSTQTTSSYAALPGNPNVTDGQATFNYSQDSQQLVVDQKTSDVKISWGNFDICPTCSVVYQQPGVQSWAWNTVTGGILSQILGSLSANGHLALINPAGILIGPLASIKAAGFLASTLNIQDALRNDSLNKTVYTLMKDPVQENSFIINKGTIQVNDQGVITLVGGAVQNEGLILAKLGKVNIASGEKVALELEDNGLMSVAIDQPVTSQVAGVDSAIANLGQIESDGGIVTLTAKTLKDVFQYAINNEGVIRANSLVNKNGEIYLISNDVVRVNGELDASGRNAGEKGGTVQVLGDEVGLFENAKIDVSGNAGGGEVLVGGDYQGQGAIPTASYVVVAPGADIKADALNFGDGGKVIVWSDQGTSYYGTISAKGGMAGGNGGFAEVSGENGLEFRGDVDLSAPLGALGELLLDPTTITIHGGSGSSGFTGTISFGAVSPTTIYESEIEALNANIVLDAGKSITTSGTFGNSDVLIKSNRNLTLETRNNATDGAGGIDLTGSANGNALEFRTQGTGTITINGSTDGSSVGNITVGKLTTAGGSITLHTNNGTITLANDISSHGGNVQLDALQGDAAHLMGSDTITGGGNFRGNAGRDYILYDGSSIDAASGVIDLKAGRDIYLGKQGAVTQYLYDWTYVSGSRSYKFLEFGYYLNNGGSGDRHLLASGTDIGVVGPFVGSGKFTLDASLPVYLYGIFADGSTVLAPVYQEARLNADNKPHLLPYTGAGCGVGTSCTGFEDTVGSHSDYDYNDAVINLVQTKVEGATLHASDAYLTAVTGGIHQTGGDVVANNLMTSTNTGMDGVGTNGGLRVSAGNISALNRGLGNILFDDKVSLVLNSLTGKTGLNTGVVGTNGIENQGNGGKIDIISQDNLSVNAPVTSTAGDIQLTATHNISQAAAGDVTINQVDSTLLNAPIPDVKTGDSHLTGQWQSGISNDPTIDMQWKLADASTTAAKFTATAGGTYTMDPGSVITTNGGAVKIESVGNLKVAKIDAGSGNVSLKSTTGSILNNEPALTANIFARNILQVAAVVVLGTNRLSYPQGIGFVYKWNTGVTNPNPLSDNTGFTASFDSGTGDWIFYPTVTPTLTNSQNWYFNVATTKGASQSATGFKGAFWIDVTAPVITAGTATGTAGNNGWWKSDVTVPFSATDNLSGFAPSGSLTKDLGNQTTSGEGTALMTGTSAGACDRAGNCASGIQAGPFKVDKTVPIVSASILTNGGTPNGTNGWFTTDVTSHGSATDAVSGVATFEYSTNGGSTWTTTTNPKDVITSLEGTGLSVTFKATDNAGWSNTASTSFKIDKTAPIVSASILTNGGTPNGTNGWFTTDVTSHGSATDAVSGVATFAYSTDGGTIWTPTTNPKDVITSLEGTGLSVIFRGTNGAGLSNTASTSFKIDKTAPDVSAAITGGTLGANSWYTTDVTSHGSATDAVSGVATFEYSTNGGSTWTTTTNPKDVITSLEGTGLSVIFKAVNGAGLSNTASTSFKIDKTAPDVTAFRVTPANGNGWNNTDVDVSYTATDSLSGIDTGASDVKPYTLTSEGAGQSHTFTVYDLAGNLATGIVNGINIDKTAPSVLAFRLTAANANGWNNTNVAVSYTATDALSGIDTVASDTKPVTLSSEGADQSHTFTVYDLAGNSGTGTVEGINIDKTAPDVTAFRVTPANGNGWNNINVDVSYTATDSLSGIDAAASDAKPFTLTSEGADQSHTFTAYDLAGNSATGTVEGINIDKTAPDVTAFRVTPANGNGWNNTDVDVSYTATDGLSGIDTAASDAKPVTLSSEGAGQSHTFTAYDLAGNSATGTVEGINIDKTAPDVTAFRVTPANAHGWNNTDVDVLYTATDGEGSGIDTEASDAKPFTLTAEGAGQSHTFTAYDLAGNSGTGTVSGINIDKTPPTITAGVPIGVQNPDGTYSTDVTLVYSASDSLSGLPPEGAHTLTGYDTQTTSGPGVDLLLTPAPISDLAGNIAQGEPSAFTVIFPTPPTAAFGLLGDQFRFKIPPKDITQTYLISATQGPINFVANQVFFYHPLTEVGSYEVPALDAEMYNFIDGNITYSNPAVLPLQIDERKRVLPVVK